MLSDDRLVRKLEEVFPAHTCVDQPNLLCPACLKWTGDGFATVKSNPQCFPDVLREPALDTTHCGTSGYAVMIRVRLEKGWAWRTWMRYDTQQEALAHAREGSKVVPFGSVEWAELRNFKAVEPPSQQPEDIGEQPDKAKTLVKFVLHVLRDVLAHKLSDHSNATGSDPSVDKVARHPRGPE